MENSMKSIATINLVITEKKEYSLFKSCATIIDLWKVSVSSGHELHLG